MPYLKFAAIPNTSIDLQALTIHGVTLLNPAECIRLKITSDQAAVAANIRNGYRVYYSHKDRDYKLPTSHNLTAGTLDNIHYAPGIGLTADIVIDRGNYGGQLIDLDDLRKQCFVINYF